MPSKGKKKTKLSRKDYESQLHELWIELVKLQRHNIAHDRRCLVILEGRDAAGKDGTIKRICAHLSPRETRVVALGKPSDRDRTSWYFQRWAPYLPAADEAVLFNRSWYNRAGVERVMGFCTPAQTEEFLEEVPLFEQMLVRSGIKLFKYYLDISRKEQAERLADRHKDPLKQWKISPIDAVALERYDDYSAARDEMLERTHNAQAPWTIARADVKKVTRLNLIRDLLSRLEYEGRRDELLEVNRDFVYQYDGRNAELEH
jgi:polyphosphate kinase 2